MWNVHLCFYLINSCRCSEDQGNECSMISSWISSVIVQTSMGKGPGPYTNTYAIWCICCETPAVETGHNDLVSGWLETTFLSVPAQVMAICMIYSSSTPLPTIFDFDTLSWVCSYSKHFSLWTLYYVYLLPSLAFNPPHLCSVFSQVPPILGWDLWSQSVRLSL